MSVVLQKMFCVTSKSLIKSLRKQSGTYLKLLKYYERCLTTSQPRGAVQQAYQNTQTYLVCRYEILVTGQTKRSLSNILNICRQGTVSSGL